MRKFLLLFLLFLSVSCTQDYQKDIVGWWASENSTKKDYVYYIIRENGTYKKRMVNEWFGVPTDGTDRGKWEIKKSQIIFHVETYNDKKQYGRIETFDIDYLKNKKLILKTKDGHKYVYLNID